MSSRFNVPPLSLVAELTATLRCLRHYRELIGARVSAANDLAPVSLA